MITVIGILGTSFCGSTALGMALNSHPEIAFIGEAWRATPLGHPCVMARRGRPATCPTCRNECKVWIPAEYPIPLVEMHRRIAGRLGVEALVDTSKMAHVFQQYERAGSADRYIYVGLIKDPMRIAASYRRNKTCRHDPSWGPARTARAYAWSYFQHLTFAESRNYRAIDYVAAMTTPSATVSLIAEEAGLDPDLVDPVGYRTVPLHALGGNTRARKAAAPLHVDETWVEFKEDIPPKDLSAMQEIYDTLLSRYGVRP